MYPIDILVNEYCFFQDVIETEDELIFSLGLLANSVGIKVANMSVIVSYLMYPSVPVRKRLDYYDLKIIRIFYGI